MNREDEFQRPFARLIATAHRRRIAWRAAEFSAVFGAIGATAICVVSFFQIGESAGPFLACCKAFVVTAAIGAIASLISGGPKRFDTIRALDAQLNASDLLATAAQLNGSNSDDEAVRDSVFAHADALALRVSLSDLTLRRLGYRAWGGLGVFTACVMLVSLLQPSRGEASSATSPIEILQNDFSPQRQSQVVDALNAEANQALSSTRPPEPPNLSSGEDRSGKERAQDASMPPMPPQSERLQSSSTGGSAAVGAGRIETLENRERNELAETLHSSKMSDAAQNSNLKTAAATGAGSIAPQPLEKSSGASFDAKARVVSEPSANQSDIHSPTGSAVNAPAFRSDESTAAHSSQASVPPVYRDLIREFFLHN